MPPLINYNSAAALRAFLDEKGLGMRKKLGQNFLINPAIRSRLLDTLELCPGDPVWEIGPGLGAMTAELLGRGARVTAFEIDPAFSAFLRESFLRELPGADNNFSLIEGDVLKTWPACPAPAGKELFLFGNLPYNIAAVLLADFIEKGRFFKRMVVTVQREVALRMAAGPLSSDYSSFSVLCSSVYRVKLLQTIKSSSFFPPPNVDSQGVRLDLDPAREELPALFYPLVRSLFSSRRKTVRNTLSTFADSVILKRSGSQDDGSYQLDNSYPKNSRDTAEETLRKANIDGQRRPETFSKGEFAALAASLEDIVFHGH